MSYCSTTDVNALLGPHRITATTEVTLTELGLMITGISAQLDTALRRAGALVVPAVDATLLSYLSTVCSWGSAAEALKAQFPEAVGAGESPAYAFWQKKYDAALKDLQEGTDIEVTLLGTTKQASSYFTENTTDELVPGETIGELAGKSLFTVDDKDEHPW